MVKFDFSPEKDVPSLAGKVIFITGGTAGLGAETAAADEFLAISKERRLDLLIRNAGVMAVPPGLTKDGYEIQLGTNHLGHAFKKLLSSLLRTTGSSNRQPYLPRFRPPSKKRHSLPGLENHTGYGLQGLMDSLWSEQAYQYRAILAGGYLTPTQGAYNEIWAAMADAAVVGSGEMCDPVGVLTKQLNKDAKSDELADKL
ncbi:hypothetical protein B0O99DRAFT_683148 [Bisporella sp. PMI_857]|nr:hypothetical protein B0O99DRAFT_683148 [Bisporella sp. PMI_857]